jgi:ribosomal protein S18 acetylase RimI-like enzyme
MLRQPSIARIRVGRPADAADIAGVFADSWRLAYAGLIPEPALGRIIARRDATWWSKTLKSKDAVLVLEVGGKLAGYATFGRARAPGRHGGEIYELYLGPVYQGLGFGEQMFEACRARLDHHRIKGLVVWALADNTQACHFYWRRGGRPVAASKERFGDSATLDKVAFAWP